MLREEEYFIVDLLTENCNTPLLHWLKDRIDTDEFIFQFSIAIEYLVRLLSLHQEATNRLLIKNLISMHFFIFKYKLY